MTDSPTSNEPTQRAADDEPYCRNCGYPLKGLIDSSKCPECGRPIVEVLVRDAFPGRRGYRYQSQRRLWGMPLISIASGPHGMAGGQMLDLVAEGQHLDIGSITRLQQLKTGALIEFAVEAACIMARIPAEGRTPYRGFARDIGLAFQIADDLLDHAGDEEGAGHVLSDEMWKRTKEFFARHLKTE